MRRYSLLSLIAMLALFGSVLGVRAQEADSTPAADPMAGTVVESLGSGTPTMVEGYNLVLLRLTMEPGTTIPMHHHPGPVVLYVLSGTFGTIFGEGSAVITRAATDATPAATEPAIIGSEMTLNAGDSVAYEEDTIHTMSNVGDDTLVLLASAVLDASKPGFIFMTDM